MDVGATLIIIPLVSYKIRMLLMGLNFFKQRLIPQ